MMLNTKFPRWPGDIGNPASFDWPVIYETVNDALVSNIVVAEKLPDQLVQSFVSASDRLVDRGATIIGTSCGFLSTAQSDISGQLTIPFVSSSLLLLPLLQTAYGADSVIGVLTFDVSKLGPIHTGSNQSVEPANITVTGLDPNGYWHQCIKQDCATADYALAGADVLETVRRHLQRHPDTQVLVLECTNLSPWKQQIRNEFGLPVFDLVDTLDWLYRCGSGSAIDHSD